jgi:tetratricopeptide (TPR) repeat protein/TolB-like protein
MAKPIPNLSALVAEELARLIDSDALRRAPSHMRLLRYLVEKRVAGDDHALRETAIALEVFRRDPSTYDSQTDPIVRVTTGRLRDRLDTHYARFDTPPKLRIVLPRGRYAPEFISTDASVTATSGIAVLGTRNTTGDPAFDARCASFADTLADHLARAGLPRVLARPSVDAAEGESRLPLALAARLNVTWLVDSTLARESEHEARLSVRLIYAGDAGVRWVETGVGPIAELHRLADRVLGQAIVRTVETLPGPSMLNARSLRPSALSEVDRSALDRARLLLLQRTLAGTDEALSLIGTVTSTAPQSAEAWAALAAAQYSRLSFQDRDIEPIVEEIRTSDARALALDPDHPVALRTKAIIAAKVDLEVDTADELFERVVRALPNYTSARLNYAEVLTMRGRCDEAIAQLNLARIYDPLSASVNLASAHCLSLQRRYDEARAAWAMCRAGGEASPWVLTGAALTELAAGDVGAAEPMLREAVARFPDTPMTLIASAYLAAARGDGPAARAIEADCVARFPNYSSANLAVLAAMLSERDAAMALLDAAHAKRDMNLLPAIFQPAFDWLGDDPDFRAFLVRCGVDSARRVIALRNARSDH